MYGEIQVRLTVPAEDYVRRMGAVAPDGVSLPLYCLRDASQDVHDTGARPIEIIRCPIVVNPTYGAPLADLGVSLMVVSGDPIRKLAEYEDIHVVPGALRAVYEEYHRLMKNTCYECDLYGTKDCKYPPKWGQNIRINCPFFRHQLSIEEGELTD